MILALILAAQALQATKHMADGPDAPPAIKAYAERDVWMSDVATVGPTFKRSPKGWMPTCPAGMDLIRHDPPPDCFWGTAPMHVKPTQGDFECVSIATMPKLPACPNE